MSQKNTSKRAKKMGIAEEALKLPPVTRIAWGELRERDWANVITTQMQGTNKAHTWLISKGSIGEHILQCPKGDGSLKSRRCASARAGTWALGAANGAVSIQPAIRFTPWVTRTSRDADEAAKQKKRNGNQGYNFPGGKRSFWALAIKPAETRMGRFVWRARRRSDVHPPSARTEVSSPPGWMEPSACGS